MRKGSRHGKLDREHGSGPPSLLLRRTQHVLAVPLPPAGPGCLALLVGDGLPSGPAVGVLPRDAQGPAPCARCSCAWWLLAGFCEQGRRPWSELPVQIVVTPSLGCELGPLFLCHRMMR